MQPVEISGVGIHTGVECRVILSPAEPGSGIRFRSGEIEIPARHEFVVDTNRCTVLGHAGKTISTVEHLLSACAGTGVYDLMVDVNGPELPIGDGSAAIWVDALRKLQLTPQRDNERVSLREPVVVKGKGGAFVALYPAETLTITVAVSFEHPLIGTQLARYRAGENPYAGDIAPARTFGFLEEVEALRAAGLAKGGSLENAVIIYPDRYSLPLRFENELARHKLLDLMGDLLLATGKILPVADIIALKPSHRLNTQAAAALSLRLAD